MYLCLQLGEAGAFSPFACFAQLGGRGARKCSSIVAGHRALNQLVVEAVAFFKLSAIHYLAHCNLKIASGLHRLRGDISPSGTIAWITRERGMRVTGRWWCLGFKILVLGWVIVASCSCLFMCCYEAEVAFM